MGITIVTGRKFKCSLQLAKQKFFSAANGVLGKIGVNQHNLILSLVDVFCISVLLYGTEALLLSKSDRNAKDFTYSTIFFKIFNVKETRTIKQCQFYSGCLPTSFTIDLRVYNFLNAIKYQKNSLQLQLFTWFGQEELIQITNKYLINAKDNCRTIKDKLFDYLESELSWSVCDRYYLGMKFYAMFFLPCTLVFIYVFTPYLFLAVCLMLSLNWWIKHINNTIVIEVYS